MTLIQVNDGSRVAGSHGDIRTVSGNKNFDAYVMGHGDAVGITFVKAALAASEAFSLIDLSDIANFQHTEIGKIRLYTLDVIAEVESDGVGTWIIYIGVVVEVDDTDGTAQWIAVLPLETYVNPDDDQINKHWHFEWAGGLDLEVDSANDTLANHLTNSSEAANAHWQDDANLDSPAGDTTSPSGDGDLVMLCDETADGSTLDITVIAQYATESTD